MTATLNCTSFAISQSPEQLRYKNILKDIWTHNRKHWYVSFTLLQLNILNLVDLYLNSFVAILGYHYEILLLLSIRELTHMMSSVSCTLINEEENVSLNRFL